MSLDRKAEASRKADHIIRAIRRGQASGALHGRLPVASPIIGACRGWWRATIALLKEDLSS